MKNASLLSLFLCLFLAACNQSEKGTTLVTGNIFKPILFQIDDKDADKKVIDLGEHVLTDAPRELTIKIYNDSGFPYTDFELVFATSNSEMPSINFVPDELGEIKFPGQNGTCKQSLPSKATCIVKLLFSPRNERAYTELIDLKFKNYVDEETHSTSITALVGMPASLVFTNDQTQYSFGDLIGAQHIPVVERADAITYTQEMEVTNAGGLSARNMNVSLSQTCISTETNLCPMGMGNVYSYVSDCPAKLMPGEKCRITMSYAPKNQDPASGPVPEEIKEINYRSTFTLAYEKDPHGATAGLNAYYRSLSTNIEAKFKVSITNLVFETPIIVGNRDVRTFRINNLGFREGEIKALAMRDSGGTLIATCGPADGTLLLECRSSSNVLLSLEQFPYTIKDRNDCLRTSTEEPYYVTVGSGCVFDLTFQPSVNYLADKTTEFKDWQPEVIYDARWKGLEKIVTRKLFTVSAESKAAARMILQRVTYDSTNVSTFPGNSPWSTNFGRLALQAPAHFKRKPIAITFKNIGSIPAMNITLKDGRGTNIPIGGAGANLGPWGPLAYKQFYSPVTASSSSCTRVDPGASCTITASFSPVSLNDEQKEFENMFDYIDPDSYTVPAKKANNYKSFILSYDSGATYTDLNRQDPQDYPRLSVESRVNAILVKKGMLMQLGDNPYNESGFGNGFNTAGDKWVSTFYVTNMGTGEVPYMRVLNIPSATATNPSLRTHHMRILPTPDFAAKNADYDCTSLFDLDYTITAPINEMPEVRDLTVDFHGLPQDKTCVFSVEYTMDENLLKANSRSCNELAAPSAPEELSRFFSREFEAANSGRGLWEFCSYQASVPQGWMNISISYFDGDSSDPGALSGLYGNRFNLEGWDLLASQMEQAKFTPVTFGPWLQGTLYRPGFTLPAIPSLGKAMRVIPEAWFYGTVTMPYMLEVEPLQINPIIQAGVSRHALPLLSAWGNRGNYDYIIYIGTYPQGASIVKFPLNIRNIGSGIPTVSNFVPNSTTPPVDASFTLESINNFPQVVGGGSDIMSTTALTPITFGFNPAIAGEHTMDITFKYQRGHHDNIIYYDKDLAPKNPVPNRIDSNAKFLVVANVLATGTHPKLTLDMQDYDVVQNPGFAPIVTPTTITTLPLTWNYTPSASNIIFDTIKLTSVPNASDVYAKKTLTFKNQTAFPLQDLKLLYRIDTLQVTPKIMPMSFSIITGESTCTSGQTIPAGGNCTITFKYQPIGGDIAENIVLTALYKIAPHQYTMQNLNLSLMPRSPALVKEMVKATVAINIKPVAGTSSQIVRDSYEMTFGTVNLNVVPKTFVWNQPSGTFASMRYVNTQSTKASFLLSYHKYLAEHSLRGFSPMSPPGTAIVPSVGEYRTVSGHEFVPIFMRKYTDNSVRILIEASKGCIFGDDELDGAVPSHLKGFNTLTATPCFMITTFNANFEYLQDDIRVIDGDDMRNVATELWYYSVNRSSTASLWTHIKGIINPDSSTLSGAYANVKAFDNRTVSFEIPKFTADNPLLGPVIGTRIILATSASALNNPYNPALTSYVDIRPYSSVSPQVANFTTGMSNGNYYYYRAVAIRRDVRFTYNVCPAAATCRFPGLAAGEYLSAGSNTQVKILVPPTNHAYFYNANIIVEKTLQGGVAYDPYGIASNKCTTKTQVIIRDPGIIQKPYTLISRVAWNLLTANPTATTYSSMDQVSHWLSDAPASIDAKCGALSGFVPNSASQLMDPVKTFYLRSSANPNANVNQAVGGIPGTASSNYNSYIDGTVGFASSRCMVTLGAPIP